MFLYVIPISISNIVSNHVIQFEYFNLVVVPSGKFQLLYILIATMKQKGEADIAYSVVLFQHLPQGTEGNLEKRQ
jgi:hypothetical protein